MTETKVVTICQKHNFILGDEDCDYCRLVARVEDSEYRNVHLEKAVDDFKARVEELEGELSSICDTETADDYEDRIATLAGMVNKEQAENQRLREDTLEEVLVITDGMEGTEWDACGDWLGRKVRALKEPTDD